MRADSEATNRTPAEYVLFALGFIGFLLLAGGVVITSPFVVVSGVAALFVSVLGLVVTAPA